MTRTPYVDDWLARAAEDLRAARVLFDEGGMMNTVCFHCHQAAEKLLKGLLAAYGQHVRKIHDLELLLQDGLKYDHTLTALVESVQVLSPYYIETRYPGDLLTFTVDDARAALEAAQTIETTVTRVLADSGSR